MTEKFDPKKSYTAVKFHEDMIAFTGFRFQFKAEDTGLEGLLKIASADRAYRGNELTLTFLLDTAGDSDLKVRLAERFHQLNRQSLAPFLGQDFEDASRTSLDDISDLQDWVTEELQITFSTQKDNFKTTIEQHLLPALEKLLKVQFQPLEWWPESSAQAHDPLRPEWSKSAGFEPFKVFFKKWFTRG